MTSRILLRGEWRKLLAGTELEKISADLPAAAMVLIVEQESELVGCWGLIPQYHLHGFWIAPAHRGKSAVFRRLWKDMAQLAQCLGLSALITGAGDQSIERMLEKRGAVPFPIPLFVLPVKEVS